MDCIIKKIAACSQVGRGGSGRHESKMCDCGFGRLAALILSNGQIVMHQLTMLEKTAHIGIVGDFSITATEQMFQGTT